MRATAKKTTAILSFLMVRKRFSRVEVSTGAPDGTLIDDSTEVVLNLP